MKYRVYRRHGWKTPDTDLNYPNNLTKLDPLVIDNFDLMDLGPDKYRDLFEVLDTQDR